MRKLITILSLFCICSLSIGQMMLPSIISSGNKYEFETYELTGSLTTPLSDTAIFKTNRLIKMLKDSIGVDTLSEFFDRFYLLANETAEASVYDLCDSALARRCTAVNSPTHTAFEGFTFNGISNYLNSNYNAATQGVNYTLNNCAIGTGSRSNVADGLKVLVGVRNGTISYATIVPYYSGKTSLTLNSTASVVVVETNSSTNAYFSVTRNGSAYTNIIGYKNKTALTTIAGTSNTTEIPNFNFYIGARNNSNTAEAFWNGQISCVFFSKYITAELNRKIVNCIEYYMDSNGKGIIP